MVESKLKMAITNTKVDVKKFDFVYTRESY